MDVKDDVSSKNLEDEVKKAIITSIYSNDFLMEYLVLKGGNAIAYVHQVALRQSVDVDFSLSADFDGDEGKLESNLESALNVGFNQLGYHFFDFKFEARPKKCINNLGSFWGGYGVTFKIITNEKYLKLTNNGLSEVQLLENFRRNAVTVSGSTKIEIDISRAEITSSKVEVEVDGLTVYAYSTEMIIAEKLRAICQQMTEYGPIIKRDRAGSSRAKDFFDINLLCNHFNIDMSLPDNIFLIKKIFEIKKVPLGSVEHS